MKKNLRVLQITWNNFTVNGVYVFLKTYYENIDRNKIQFDFLAPGRIADIEGYKYLISLGANIFNFNIKVNIVQPIKLFFKLKKFLKNNHYAIVHINTGSLPVMLSVSMACKINNVPHVICHIHSSCRKYKLSGKGVLKYLRKQIDRTLIKFFITHYFSCSMEGFKSKFGKKLAVKYKPLIIKNAIDSKKFIFNCSCRDRLRSRMEISNKFVIGYVSNFVDGKNHLFLINVFNEVLKQNPDSVLLLVGDGELKDLIQKKVKALGIEKNVIFTGSVNNVNEYLQAMDVFVFPSTSEGLGIVAIEAQAAGLKTICADTIPNEAKITENFIYMSLNKSAKEWSEEILKYKDGYERKNMYDQIVSAGYDIKYAAKELEDFYLSL